jgi:hypothetical protein
MKENKTKQDKGITETGDSPVPEYIPPKIKTYTSEEVLEQIGPAKACSGGDCGID